MIGSGWWLWRGRVASPGSRSVGSSQR
jgi:hypothetical protein